jgi:hypothetical protein
LLPELDPELDEPELPDPLPEPLPEELPDELCACAAVIPASSIASRKVDLIQQPGDPARYLCFTP